MKKGIHPKYVLANATCACGATFKVRSTRPEYRLEICSSCHPFFTGQQRFVDTAGRVEKFRQRYQKKDKTAEVAPAEVAPAEAPAPAAAAAE